MKLFEKFIPKKDPYSLKVGSKSAQAIPTESLHMNVEIVGGTGSGKTHFVLKPFIEQTITQGLGCFIYDVKGNMDSDIGFYVHKTEKEQCRSISLYHFNLNNYQTSHTYNPLYGDDPDAIANRLHTALYYDTRHSEPYYVELAEMFLKNIIALLKKHFGVITFQDLLLATQETDTFRSIQALCAENPNSPQAFYFRTQWLQKPAKQRREELLGLITRRQNSSAAGLCRLR